MKTLLLPFHDSDASEIAFETGYLLAKACEGYLEGLLCLENPSLVLGQSRISVHPDYLTQLAHEWRAQADQARGRFIHVVEKHQMPLREVTVTGEGTTAGWHESEGREEQVVADYGRLFDAIVVGRAPEGAQPDWERTCEAALFQTGRPVIVCPAKPPATLGTTVVIAWNGSLETARTIGLGMPLLLTARKVVVLTVEGWLVPVHTGKQVAEHLIRNGIDATTRIANPDGRSSGETILDETRDLGADLLVKGAYTHARLTQMIFGGATRHILSHAEVPVLMAH